MAYAYCCIQVAEGPLNELVDVDAKAIIKSEQGVLGEDSLDTKSFSSHIYTMTQNAGALMSMYNIDVFSDQDLTN